MRAKSRANPQDTNFRVVLIVDILGGVVLGPIRQEHELWVIDGCFDLGDISAVIADQVPGCWIVGLALDDNGAVQPVHQLSSYVRVVPISSCRISLESVDEAIARLNRCLSHARDAIGILSTLLEQAVPVDACVSFHMVVNRDLHTS